MDKRFAFSVDNIPHTDFNKMQKLQDETLATCRKKDAEYGASWCKRGGVGAFFTVWRKADRLEEQLRMRDFNLFDVSDDPNSTESLDETIRDFANYLYLVLEKRQAIRNAAKTPDARPVFRVDTPITDPELLRKMFDAAADKIQGTASSVKDTIISQIRMRAAQAGIDLSPGEAERIANKAQDEQCGGPTNGYVDQDRK